LCVLALLLLPPPAEALREWGIAVHAPDATCNELSTSIGSHMVLQRAPEQAVIYGSVCGKLTGAKSISVSIDGGTPTTSPITSQSWQVKLPPQTGGLTPHTLKIAGGSLNVTLDDVLFGDMILCSGQSNSKQNLCLCRILFL
jgi:sialate O-acetylesterase